MYYLELIYKFWDFNQKARLNTTAVAMYLYLLKLGNDRGGYDISITDMALANILSITRKTVKPTKEKLRSWGLLQYENRGGFPCSYRLLLDYSLEVPENKKAKKTEIKRKSSDRIMASDELLLSIDDIPPILEDRAGEPLTNFKILNHPSWEEFLEYAQILDGYNISLNPVIKRKYCSWVENNWKNVTNRPITNWKSSLKSALPYIIMETNYEVLSVEPIPKIKRPKL